MKVNKIRIAIVFLLSAIITYSCGLDTQGISVNNTNSKNNSTIKIDSLVRISTSNKFLSVAEFVTDSSKKKNKHYFRISIYKVANSWLKGIVQDSFIVDDPAYRKMNGHDKVVYEYKRNMYDNIPYRKFKKIRSLIIYPQLGDPAYKTGCSFGINNVSQCDSFWYGDDIFQIRFWGGKMDVYPIELKKTLKK